MVTVFFRTVILYLTVTIGLRVMGKRQIGELEPSELVVTILISELAAIPMQDIGIPLLVGIIPIATLIGMEFILTSAILKSVRFRVMMCGKPSMIIENGCIMQDQMHRNRFTIDELIEELRAKDITDISQVKYGILEPNGTLSIIPFSEFSSVKAGDMGLSLPEKGLPVIVINDGRVLQNNLQLRGYNRAWLDAELKSRKISSPGAVFLMTLDDSGGIYISEREKKKGG